MGWKNITFEKESFPSLRKTPNQNMNPLGPNRKEIHPTDEKRLRSIHSELLSHEADYLNSRRQLSKRVLELGYKPSAAVLGLNGKTLRDFVKTSMGGLRTLMPRFDWQENCQYCARPFDGEIKSVATSFDTPNRDSRETINESSAQELTDLYKTVRDHQTAFNQKKIELAYFITAIGPNPTARLFNNAKASMLTWIRNNRMLKPDAQVFVQRPKDGNCPGCERPVSVGEN